jgi:hypothetical protein
MADGTLIFDTRIDTKDVDKELESLRGKFFAVNEAIRNQAGIVKRLEQEYSDLMNSGLTANATIAKEAEAAQKNLLAERVELERLKDKSKQYNREINDALKRTAAASEQVVSSMNRASKGIGSFIKRLSSIAQRAFVFSVIYKSLRLLTRDLSATAKSSKDLTATMYRLRGALAQAFTPLLQAVLPSLISFINWMSKAIATIAAFIRLLLGQEGQASNVTASLGGQGKAMSKVGKNAKKSTKDLASFDKINKLTEKTSKKTTDGMSDQVAAMACAMNTQPDLKWLEWAKEHIDAIKMAAEAVGLVLGAWAISKLLGTSFTKTLAFLASIKGAIMAVRALMNMDEFGVNWDNLGKFIVGALIAIAGAAVAFGPKVAGVTAIIFGIVGAVEAIRDALKNGVNWKNLTLFLASATALILGMWLVFGGTAALWTAAGVAIAGLALAVYDALKNGINWANLTLGLASATILIGAIWALFGGTAAFWTAAGVAVGGLILAVHDACEHGINWQNITLGLGAAVALIGTLAALFGVTGAGVGAALVVAVIAFTDAWNEISKNGMTWKAALDLLAGGIAIVSAALLFMNASNPFGWIALAVAGIVLLVKTIHEHWDAISKWFKEAWGAVWGWIKENIFDNIAKFWKAMWEGIKAVVLAVWTWLKTTIIDPIANAFKAMWEGIKTVAEAVWNGIKAGATAMWNGIKAVADTTFNALKSAWNTIGGFFSSLWNGISSAASSAWNGIVSVVTAPIHAIQNAWESFKNWFSNLWSYVKSAASDMMSSASGGGGRRRMSYVLPDTGTFEVPLLAKGAVIPPNSPYLAMVGDQSSGTNIETPLETMVQAFKQALSESGNNNAAVLQVDGVTFGQLVWKYNSSENNRIGVNLAQVNR